MKHVRLYEDHNSSIDKLRTDLHDIGAGDINITWYRPSGEKPLDLWNDGVEKAIYEYKPHGGYRIKEIELSSWDEDIFDKTGEVYYHVGIDAILWKEDGYYGGFKNYRLLSGSFFWLMSNGKDGYKDTNNLVSIKVKYSRPTTSDKGGKYIETESGMVTPIEKARDYLEPFVKEYNPYIALLRAADNAFSKNMLGIETR